MRRSRPSGFAPPLALALAAAVPVGAGTLPVLDVPETRLLAPVPDSLAHFGRAVAACGDTLVVGAPQDDLFAMDGGAAYVYRRENGQLVHLQTLLPPPEDRLANWQHGLDVDLVCGWPIEIIAVAYEAEVAGGIGGAYVYERDAGGVWQLSSELAPVLAESNDDCGVAVALDASVDERNGEDIVVYRGVLGCPNTDVPGQYVGGAAYLFERQEGSGDWGGGAVLFQSNLLNPGDQRSDENFGAAVDLSGDWVVVGTPGDFNAGYAGAVHVFGGGGTAPCTKLVPTTVHAGSYFGWGVSIDPWHIVAGAFGEDDSGLIDAGAVYTWDRFGPIELCNTAVWPLQTAFDQRITLPDSETSDQLGLSVRVETPFLVASLNGHPVPPNYFVGGAVVYRLDESDEWAPVGRLEPETAIGGSEGVGQGGVAFAAGVVYAGAPNDGTPPSSGVGSVFVWEAGPAVSLLFADGFESGDTSRWSSAVP